MKPYLFRLPEWLGRIPDWFPGLGGVQIGGRPIFSYGVMLGLSFLIGAILALRLSSRLGADRTKTPVVMMWAAIGAILGARVLYFVASAPEAFTLARFFRFQDGGLVAYGGFLGGIGAGIVAARWLRTDLLSTGDGIAPALLLGTGITRTGCFLFGCDYGQPTNLPWALHFPRWDNPAITPWIKGNAPAYTDHVNKALVTHGSGFSDGVHPTQLLMSLNGFLGFAVLMLLLPYRRFRGQLLAAFLIYYGVTRFLVELLRGDAIRGVGVMGTPFSTSQLISLLLVPVGVATWVFLARWQQSTHRLK